MKSIISAIAATATLAAITPAQADSLSGYGRSAVQPGYSWQYSSSVSQHPLTGLREINQRQVAQRTRIDNGFHRGVITRWEFRRLVAEQQDIQAMERAFVSDGYLAPRERMELHRRLGIASQHIAYESRYGQRRL